MYYIYVYLHKMSKNLFTPPEKNLYPLGSNITSFVHSPTKLLNNYNFAWNRKWKRLMENVMLAEYFSVVQGNSHVLFIFFLIRKQNNNGL